MAVLIEIARLVAGMSVMLAGRFLPPSLVTVAVLVEIAGLVARVVVMLSGFFSFRHCASPSWGEEATCGDAACFHA